MLIFLIIAFSALLVAIVAAFIAIKGKGRYLFLIIIIIILSLLLIGAYNFWIELFQNNKSF